MTKEIIESTKDGIDHINVYSKGLTSLGRDLSNFSHSPFTHPYYGEFKSVEGFWYWLSTGMEHHQLRYLHGFAAKKEGKLYPKVKCKDFEVEIKRAICCKIEQSLNLKSRLKNSSLPFKHYYNYGGKVVFNNGSKFIIDYLEELRAKLKKEEVDCNGT